MTPQELFDDLFEKKCQYKRYAGYAETVKDLTFQWFQCRWEGNEPVMKAEHVPAGTTVRIVMVSRFGDVGLSTRLDKEFGYGIRVEPTGEFLKNCRLTPPSTNEGGGRGEERTGGK